MAKKVYIPFYVILQGEFALFYDKKAGSKERALCIRAPFLKEHSYIAGPWMEETDLVTKAELRLTNAKGGSAKPEDFPELFVNFGKIDRGGFEAACPHIDLRAPLPYTYIPGLREDASKDCVTSGGIEMKQPKHPAVISILLYKWELGTRLPRIEGTGQKWEAGMSSGCGALHIFASGRKPETEIHAKRAFEGAAALLGIELIANSLKGQADSKWAEAPAGLSMPQVNLLLHQRQALITKKRSDLLFQDEYIDLGAYKIITLENGNCGTGRGFEGA